MTEQPTEKTCTKCGETKPLEEFGRNKNASDGLQYWCRQCFRDYRNSPGKKERKRELASKPEARAWDREYQKQYRQRGYAKERRKTYARERNARPEVKERTREAARAWRSANPEKARAKSRRHYWKYPETHRTKERERLSADPAYRERKLAATRDWQRRNPQSGWRNAYLLRCRKFSLNPIIEDFTKDDVIAKYGDRCAYCETGEFENLDHYTPVAQGGPHTLENVRPACFACNRAKSDADPEEWLADQAEFDALTEDEQNALIDAEIAKYLNEED